MSKLGERIALAALWTSIITLFAVQALVLAGVIG